MIKILRFILDLFFGGEAPPPVVRTTDMTFAAAFSFIMDPSRDGNQNDTAQGEKTRTSWGITQETWNRAVGRGIVKGVVADATQDQAQAIYKVDYWNAAACPLLPPSAAFVVFCDSVLTGVGHVARLVQRIVHVPEDGIIGPATVHAVMAMNPTDFVDAFIHGDEQYEATLAVYSMYAVGWTRREEATRQAAYKLIV